MTATTVRPVDLRPDVRLRITRRGRVVLGLLIASVALSLAFLMGMASFTPAAEAGSTATTEYVTVTVHEGDTLWGIASQYAPEGTDVRDYILMVEDLNDLQNGVVQRGQSLHLPVS